MAESGSRGGGKRTVVQLKGEAKRGGEVNKCAASSAGPFTTVYKLISWNLTVFFAWHAGAPAPPDLDAGEGVPCGLCDLVDDDAAPEGQAEHCVEGKGAMPVSPSRQSQAIIARCTYVSAGKYLNRSTHCPQRAAPPSWTSKERRRSTIGD